MKCPNCGSLIDDNSKFCVACGSPITPAGESSFRDVAGSSIHSGESSFSQPPIASTSLLDSSTFSAKVCPYCGYEVDFGQSQCTQCGRRIPTSIDDFPTSETKGSTSKIDGAAQPSSWLQSQQSQSYNMDSAFGKSSTTLSLDEANGHNPAPPVEHIEQTPARNNHRIAAIVGAVVAVVALLAVGIVFLANPAPQPKSEPTPKEESAAQPSYEPGSLVGHFTMSDADYGTADYTDAIVLDASENGDATLLYRGNMVSGKLQQASETEDTFVYKLRNLKDDTGKELPNAVVTMEVPKTFTPNNLAGMWRMCYRNEDDQTSISDWAVVNDDGETGVAGFSNSFDIFSVSREYVQQNSSRRAWTKNGEGKYRITAPDKNGVERIIYISGN
ncbi:MAG: zinc ribbon domain-containing protein [Atopobiaceae bacterium]|nr:zinc ribbon domain-containing protein [Atopobiaceae bacterium]